MKRCIFTILVLLLVVGCQPAEESPTPTEIIQPTVTASPTLEPTATVTPTPTPDVPPMTMTGMDYQIMITDGPEGALYRLGIGWHVDANVSPPIAVSPDSSLLALPATTGLYIFTADSFEPVWAATDQSFVVRAVWSPDGSLVAGLDRSGAVSVFTASDGTRQNQFQVDFEYWAKMGISPDNRLIFVGEHLFDLDTGEELTCVDCAYTGDDDYDTQRTFTSNNVLRAAHPCDEAVFCLWDSGSGEVVPYPLAGVQEGGPLSISPDGNWVIVRTDNTVRLFDVQTETYRQLPELINIPFDDYDFYWVGNVSWAPDSRAFTINAGERVYLFQPESETSTLIWEGKEYHYYTVTKKC